MRYGYKFISLIWAVVLITAIHYYQRYMSWYSGYDTQFAITSSSYLAFSFIVDFITTLVTCQRFVTRRNRRLVFFDPMVHIPNLRTLNRGLKDPPWLVLYFLGVPSMELLVRNYDIMLRTQYKQRPVQWITPLLERDERVYQLSGNDLTLRFNTELHQERIEALDRHIKQFRFAWGGMPLQPQVGTNFCYIRSPVSHIYLLLGELNTIIELSLATNSPKNLQRRGVMHLQYDLKDKVAMMSHIQQTLENNHLSLKVQPIFGVREDVCHKILLRLEGDDGEAVAPDNSLPVAHEFGLSSRTDLWMIENTLKFTTQNRERMPAH